MTVNELKIKITLDDNASAAIEKSLKGLDSVFKNIAKEAEAMAKTIRKLFEGVDWGERIEQLEKTVKKFTTTTVDEVEDLKKFVDDAMNESTESAHKWWGALGDGVDWNKVSSAFDKGISGLAGIAKIGFDAILRIAESVFNAIAKIARVSFEIVGDAFKDTIKEAQKFENAMILARRTMGITKDETEALGSEVLKLSTELGAVSADRLGEVMGMASQLGLRGTDSLKDFAEAMVKVEATTDITAEVAAAAFPKIMRIIGVATEDMGKEALLLGNRFDVLGNKMGEGAKHIMDVALTLSPAAARFKMTSDQFLALSGTVAESSVRFVGAGNNMNTILSTMATNTAKFAEVLGIDFEELGSAIDNADVVGALQMVVDSLNDIEKTEGVMAAQTALSDLGFQGVRTNTMMSQLTETIDRYDFALTELQKETADNLTINKEYETAMGTLTKQIDTSTNIIDNIQKVIGGPFRDALTNVLQNGINPLIKGIFTWIQNNEVLKTNFERVQYALTAAALDLIRVFVDVGKSIDWEEVVTQVLGKIEDLGEYVRGIDWEAKFNEVLESISGLWEYLNSQDFSDFFNETKEAISGIIRELPSLAESVKVVADVLEGLVKYTKDWITGVKLLTESIKGAFTATDKAAQDGVAAVSDLYAASVGVFPDTEFRVNETAAAVNNLTDSIGQATAETQKLGDVGVYNSTWPDTKIAVDAANVSISSMGETVGGLIGHTEQFYKVAENTWTNIKSEVRETDTAWQRNIQTVQAGASAVQGYFGALISPMQAVGDEAETTAGRIAGAFGAAGQTIERTFGQAVQLANEALTFVSSAMSTTAQTLQAAGGQWSGFSPESLQQMRSTPGMLTASGLIGAGRASREGDWRTPAASPWQNVVTPSWNTAATQTAQPDAAPTVNVTFEGTNIVDERSLERFARRVGEIQSEVMGRVVSQSTAPAGVR